MSLRRYFMDDCTIDVPAGFHDRTSHVLDWKTADGDAIALVIQRETPPPVGPIDLQRYVADQTKDYPARFAGLHVERDETADHDAGFQMRRKAFRWRKDQDVLYHHQVFVLVGEAIVILTAAAKASHRESVDVLIDDALQSFAARGD